MGAQFGEECTFARQLRFLLQSIHNLAQQSRGPLAFIKTIRAPALGAHGVRFGLRDGRLIERQECQAPATFLSALAISRVRQEMLQRPEEK